MRSTSSILAGTIAASLLVGPLLLFSLLTGLVIQYPEQLQSLGVEHFGFVILLLAASMPVGLFIGGLPILFGASVMSWLGRHAPKSRSYSVWAAAGAALATLFSIPFVASLTRDGNGEGPLLLLILSFTVPGIVCALICRHLTAWPDQD
ncbi:hypothetical protein NDN01_07445 [Sphingomonas sp. QA11]|uniref:hypothetical protein n=1 Tax=Sphingomonas sp. QA11 TaxID=2950605 RepID=UPI002349DCBC|nr:hypothetical protein [Sphingomonas sp. QA11]WCM28733.1 hypothetical protein NDN01_07445 [Sphingomonas sp. QA11]